jgi:pimeloyl-ACP methyl ester carboxylesterase
VCDRLLVSHESATSSGYPLPSEALDALRNPVPGRRTTTQAGGINWSALEWGSPAEPPVLLIHGVTSSASAWWRIAPAMAAAGYRVIAADLPGHGMTRPWPGHHRFRDTAADVAAFIAAHALSVPELAVVGHSWGAMTAAAIPLAGMTPRTLVLLDPPAMPGPWTHEMLADPVERKYDDLAEAERTIRAVYPRWTAGDIHAKAEGLTAFDESAVRSVLLDNGTWDGGIADLTAARERLGTTWMIRGEPAAGSLTPDAVVPVFAALIGDDRVVTLPGAPHSPQRTHPEALLAVLLRAIASGDQPAGRLDSDRERKAIARRNAPT